MVQNGEFPMDRVTENEYGHTDHAFGRNAHEELFPYVAGWLEEHDG
jgi:hypothetical protein